MSLFDNKTWTRIAVAGCTASIAPAVLAQHEIEEIQVIATPQDRTTAELAQSVSVLADEELRRAQSSSIGETLAGQLGISASSFGSAASRPIIRGLAGARVKLMEDGIDSLDVSTVSVDHAVGIDPLIAEQIEIFRGPTTLLYGSGAIGGVVNSVTRRIPEEVPAEGFDGAVELRGNTVADDRTGAARLDGGQDSFAWHFDMLRRDAGDYEIPGFAEVDPEPGELEPGILENSSFETTTGSVGASWLGDDAFFGIAVSSYDSNYGVPGHEHEEGTGAIAEEPPVRIDLDQTRFDVKGGWMGLGGSIEEISVRFGFNDYEHQELEGADIGTLFENRAYEGRVELSHTPWGTWDGTFGVQFGERQFSAIGEEAFIPPVDTTTLGLFILEQRDIDDWNLSLGGRLETLKHEPSSPLSPNFSDTATSVSFAGIRALGDDYALAIHTALTERLPVAEELYSNGPHLASQTFEIGNPLLSEETSRHVDLGLRKTSGTITWTLTAFYTSFADFIYLQDAGTIDAESELSIYTYEQQDADIYGLEAELFAPIAQLGTGEIDLRVFGDLVEGELDTDGKLPRMTPMRIGARVQYHDEGLVLGFESIRHAKQTDTAPFETATAGYTMVNADFSWTQPLGSGQELIWFFKGANLLDEDARRHTSLIKDIAPLPGRNFSFGLRAAF